MVAVTQRVQGGDTRKITAEVKACGGERLAEEAIVRAIACEDSIPECSACVTVAVFKPTAAYVAADSDIVQRQGARVHDAAARPGCRVACNHVLLKVMVPVFRMPPPSLFAELLLTRTSCSVSVPALKMAPPDPLLFPSRIVTPDMLAVAPVTFRTEPELLPLIANSDAPGPVVVTFLTTGSNPLVNVIVPLTEGAKRIVSPATASRSALRNESAPPSFVLVTRSVAACVLVALHSPTPQSSSTTRHPGKTILILTVTVPPRLAQSSESLLCPLSADSLPLSQNQRQI